MQKLDNLLGDIDILDDFNYHNYDITSVEFDSRKVQEGSVFVAIKGEITDGHKFINRAIGNGAKAIICQDLPKLNDSIDCTLIKVPNSRIALAKISHSFYGKPSKSLKIIGITGTNGKTTVTFLLNQIFSFAGFKTAIIGTTGIFIGDKKIPASHTTPESSEIAALMSEMINSGVQYCFMEVSSHALVQHRADEIHFDAAIFTNLSHDHLDYHKTLQEYASAKKILFDSLKNDTFAIINSDDEYAQFMVTDSKAKIINIGRSDISDYLVTNEKLQLSNLSYLLNDMKLEVNLSGRFNVDNSAMAVIAALQLGVDFELIAKALSIAKGAPGRMDKILLKNGAIAIVDYAHTPDALEKALNTCKEILSEADNNSRLISVFGCGGDRDKSKRPIMGKCSSEIADITIVTSDNPRTEKPEDIINDIISGISHKEKCKIVENRSSAIDYAYHISNKNDIILIAGKGHENYQIIGTERHHFDDKEEISKFV